MKKGLFVLFAAILFSCNSKNTVNTDSPKQDVKYPLREKIFAVYTDTGSGKKVPAIVMRVIQKAIKYDSLTKKDVITIDTIFGVERVFQSGVDSLGKPKYSVDYFLIGKDSVNWKVQGISVDSLTKK